MGERSRLKKQRPGCNVIIAATKLSFSFISDMHSNNERRLLGDAQPEDNQCPASGGAIHLDDCDRT